MPGARCRPPTRESFRDSRVYTITAIYGDLLGRNFSQTLSDISSLLIASCGHVYRREPRLTLSQKSRAHARQVLVRRVDFENKIGEKLRLLCRIHGPIAAASVLRACVCEERIKNRRLCKRTERTRINTRRCADSAIPLRSKAEISGSALRRLPTTFSCASPAPPLALTNRPRLSSGRKTTRQGVFDKLCIPSCVHARASEQREFAKRSARSTRRERERDLLGTPRVLVRPANFMYPGSCMYLPLSPSPPSAQRTRARARGVYTRRPCKSRRKYLHANCVASRSKAGRPHSRGRERWHLLVLPFPSVFLPPSLSLSILARPIPPRLFHPFQPPSPLCLCPSDPTPPLDNCCW